ncbi:hypothetical protein RchiOBHm_MTg0498951 (mitochondrion) [Rosa chinensis]|uniref:Uncharacterized protein n=1 Tax=Rosa chinensis TaxID=74649 RepID=A0A2P6P144_ROSCH|nr:hypothetical protein RchiOBHm_MTg0498951 [Rosa chinensis]
MASGKILTLLLVCCQNARDFGMKIGFVIFSMFTGSVTLLQMVLRTLVTHWVWVCTDLLRNLIAFYLA